VTQTFSVTPNLLTNGGFEGSLSPWQLFVTNDGQGSATAALDTTTFFDGKSAAHVNVTHAATATWHIDLEEGNLPLSAGATYEVQFWAKSDSARSIQVVMQGGAPSYSTYGLYSTINISPTWSLYAVSFVAPSTVTDGRLQFRLGNASGNVWLDDAQLLGVANVNQSITFPALSNYTIVSAPFPVTASASSGLPIAFTSNTQSVCTVSGNMVTLLALGTCSITANQPGSAIYDAAVAVTQSFAVVLASQTLSFPTIGNQTFGAAPFSLSATARPSPRVRAGCRCNMSPGRWRSGLCSCMSARACSYRARRPSPSWSG